MNETYLSRKDGSLVPVEISAKILEDGRIQKIIRDITDRKKFEEAFIKSQKIESLGTLAGGIAHDFNNLLAAILGNSGLVEILLKSKNHNKAIKANNQIRKATIRAKDLSQQLLTFAKGGKPIKKITKINTLIKDSLKLSISGSAVKYRCSVPNDLWPVEVDEGQINQVINNIIINAIHAMSNSGRIRVVAKNIDNIDGEKKSTVNLEDGSYYIKVSIIDNGIGIKPTVINKIFDPYFTTKETGNGLGLATSYAIINKHSGVLTVESEVNVGTKFHIYLPAFPDEIVGKTENLENLPLVSSYTGNILVMDDDKKIRDMFENMLSFIGYKVVSVKDGAEALSSYIDAKEKNEAFNVVIIDLTIQGGMGGKECIEKLLDFDPQVKAILCTAYPNNELVGCFEGHGFKGVLIKPFQIKEVNEFLQRLINC